MEPVILAIGGVIAIWAINKTARAIMTLRAQRRDPGSQERSADYGAGGIGGIDPGGGDSGGHGSGHGGC